MTKFLTAFLVLFLGTVAMAGFNDNNFDIAVMNQESSLHAGVPTGHITSGVLAFVYQAGTKTLATLYADKNHKALANPITRSQFATDGGLNFFTAQPTVDIVLAHSDGSIGKYASVTPQMHNLVLNQDGVSKCLIVPFTASTTEEQVGITLPKEIVIKDVIVEVVTGQESKTMDVGLWSAEPSGDADGLLVGVDTSVVGFKRGAVTTAGGSETYLSSYLYGALMGKGVVGTNADGDFGINGAYGYLIGGAASTAQTVSYTGSAGSSTAAGYIYVFFTHLR